MTQPLTHLAETLGQVEHFKRFPEADRLVIVNAEPIRTFPADSIIYCEGEACAGMFGLFAGHAHLDQLGPQGPPSLIAESAKGQHPIDRKDYTNTEMAARISTVPKVLSRSLSLSEEYWHLQSKI